MKLMNSIKLDPTPADGGGGSLAPTGGNPSGEAPSNPWNDGQPVAPEAGAAPGTAGGGQPPTPATPPAQPAPGTQPPAPATPPTEAPKNVVQLTTEQLSQVVRDATKAGQPPAPTPQMSQEEFNKTFNVAQVTPEHINKLFSQKPGEAVQAMNEIVQSAVRQAVTTASFVVAHQVRELQNQFSPAMSMAQERQEAALANEFLTTNPDLKGYEPLLVQLKNALISSPGFKGMTKEAAFKTLADQAREVIKKLPTQGVQPGGGTPPPTTPTPPKLTPLSGGGQGGAAGGAPAGQGAQPGESKTARALFD